MPVFSEFRTAGDSQGMVRGDWIVLPSKQKPAINVAEVKEDLRFA